MALQIDFAKRITKILFIIRMENSFTAKILIKLKIKFIEYKWQ